MTTLSTATSVREIVAREADASGLLPYLEPGLSLAPPADVAERIWGLLIRDITPHTARARQLRVEANYGTLPYAGFQLMRLVAETCQIHDFCLADLRRASLTRWVHQMKQIDAFLVSRAKSLEVYGAQFAEIRRLELEELRLVSEKAERMRRAAPLQDRYDAQKVARARTLASISELEQKSQQLSVETTALEAEHNSLSQSVDQLRSSLAGVNSDLAQLRRQMGELRPVLARGADMLESDLAAVQQRVETARRSLAETHTRGEAYGFAQEALKALHENLQRLVTLKAQCEAVREEERALQMSAAPLQRRLDHLTAEHESVLAANRSMQTQAAQWQKSRAEARELAQDLSERLKQAAAQLDALETRDRSSLEQLDRDLSATAKQLEDVEAIVRSRKQWLADFHTAEAASVRMENELAVLRGWSLAQVK